jgi:phosphate:Na+ symporter
VPRQLANANTLFNVLNTLIFIPFTALFARLAERLVKEQPAAVGALIAPRFLDDAAIAIPSLAVQQARHETGRVGDLARQMLEDFASAVRDPSPETLTSIARRFDEMAALEAAILRHLGLLRQGLLTQEESGEMQEVMEAVLSFESLGRLVAKDLTDIARGTGALSPSSETAEMLRGLYESVHAALGLAVRAVGEPDPPAAEEVLAMREGIEAQVRALLERQAGRLRPDDPDYLLLARLQMSLVDKLGRAYDLACDVARGVLGTRAMAA